MSEFNLNSEYSVEDLLDPIRGHSGLCDESIIEAAQNGADCGWSGFTYNHEAADFFDNNAELIWQLCCDSAEDIGVEDPLTFIASFNRSDMAETFQGLKILLSWFALEEAGQFLMDQQST